MAVGVNIPPYAHVLQFVFGVMLANLDAIIYRARCRDAACACGSADRFWGTVRDPEPGSAGSFRHHPRRPVDAAVCLHRSGLAGENPLRTRSACGRWCFGRSQLLLYLLHFNLWNLNSRLACAGSAGLIRFDPWLSYVLLIALSLVALYFIEKPAQRKLREWMHATSVIKEPVHRSQ